MKMVTQKNPLAASMNAKILGSGSTTVVLAHGFGTDQSVWDKIVPSLIQSSNWQVLLFDWAFAGTVEDLSLYDPSRHRTYDGFASDLCDLLDDMKVKSVVLVGHSMSGMIGCLASMKRPELFQKLVLLCASPRYMNEDGYEGGFDASNVEHLMSCIQSDYTGWATSFPSIVMGPNHPAAVDKLQKCLLRMRSEVALPLARTVFYSDHRDILGEVPVPCHIVHSTNDIVVPNSAALYIQRHIGSGKSTISMMEINGHFPQLTAPGQLIVILGSLLGIQTVTIETIIAGTECSVEL